ncbi:hypothetical protein MNBD_ALPHA12-236 [hydrothermal vent metagenome]|uniref:AMP nucleosidase n=1 Tax=hydrothermal vent metagenome TaxID=652676 RepID=A0A3B0TFA0_9ZZZZ
MAKTPKITLAIFASDKGPGDAERSSIMSQAGAYFAKRGAKLVCLAQKDTMPLPVITSARTAGGEVELIADQNYVLPPALKNIALQRIEGTKERLAKISAMVDCFVGLPGSLQSVTNLYFSVASVELNKPVVLLNHNNAFEIVRGFSVDVFAHTNPKAYKNIQFADNIEDLWNKISRQL